MWHALIPLIHICGVKQMWVWMHLLKQTCTHGRI